MGTAFSGRNFSFSSSYTVHYEKKGTRTLSIHPKENPFKALYGEQMIIIA